jgi:hypothetical protein
MSSDEGGIVMRALPHKQPDKGQDEPIVLAFAVAGEVYEVGAIMPIAPLVKNTRSVTPVILQPSAPR